jgi:hypothetical protein
MSNYPFALCLWQTRGYCEIYEEARKLAERRLLPLGVRHVFGNAVTHMGEFDRVWMNNGSCIPFSQGIEPWWSRPRLFFSLPLAAGDSSLPLTVRKKVRTVPTGVRFPSQTLFYPLPLAVAVCGCCVPQSEKKKHEQSKSEMGLLRYGPVQSRKLTRFEPAQYWGGGPTATGSEKSDIFSGAISCFQFGYFP